MPFYLNVVLSVADGVSLVESSLSQDAIETTKKTNAIFKRFAFIMLSIKLIIKYLTKLLQLTKGINTMNYVFFKTEFEEIAFVVFLFYLEVSIKTAGGFRN